MDHSPRALIGSKTVIGESSVPTMALKHHRAVVLALNKLDFFPILLARVVDFRFKFLERFRVLREHLKAAWQSGMARSLCACKIHVPYLSACWLARIGDASYITSFEISRSERKRAPSFRSASDAKEHGIWESRTKPTACLLNRLWDRGVIAVEVHAFIDRTSDRTLRWLPRTETGGKCALANRVWISQRSHRRSPYDMMLAEASRAAIARQHQIVVPSCRQNRHRPRQRRTGRHCRHCRRYSGANRSSTTAPRQRPEKFQNLQRHFRRRRLAMYAVRAAIERNESTSSATDTTSACSNAPHYA